MRGVRFPAAVLALAVWTAAATAQQPSTASSRVETSPLELTPPDKYFVPLVLEPARRVTVAMAVDGVVQTIAAPVGSTVREGQEIAQVDKAEANALLAVARAAVKEQQAAAAAARETNQGKSSVAGADARVEAAVARAELAELQVNRCTLRAPFAGRVLAATISPGQYLPKGATVVELADVTALRVLVPVDRASTATGAKVNVNVEGQVVEGRAVAVIPLPESFAPLRELSASLAAAWVTIPNPAGAFEPGQRVQSPYLPTAAIAVIPGRSIHPSDDARGTSMVQVLRNETVVDVPVRVVGSPGPDRMQVSGPFRRTDTLIVASSTPLRAGTLVKINGQSAAGGIEAVAPDPNAPGEAAQFNPPPPGVAPIGPPGSNQPRPKAGRPAGVTAPATKPAPAAGGGVPF